MQARGPLMIEHRLIERMVSLIGKTLNQAELTGMVDPDEIDLEVDFLRVYADRVHHGKEEEILFRDLETKPLSDTDRKMMNDLIEDHVLSRRTTSALVEANSRYRNGEESFLGDIILKLRILFDMYPEHIRKEDSIFFPSSRNYYSWEEEQSMLREFYEFDRKMIHEVYHSLVLRMESKY